MNVAYVIQCNDVVEAVVLNDAIRADQVLRAKRDEYYQQNRNAFGTPREYDIRCHWHITSIKVTP